MNPHILILVDEHEIAGIAEPALARANYTARIAVTAQQAQYHLASEHFDLLLLDVGSPDINGFDFSNTSARNTPTPSSCWLHKTKKPTAYWV